MYSQTLIAALALVTAVRAAASPAYPVSAGTSSSINESPLYPTTTSTVKEESSSVPVSSVSSSSSSSSAVAPSQGSSIASNGGSSVPVYPTVTPSVSSSKSAVTPSISSSKSEAKPPVSSNEAVPAPAVHTPKPVYTTSSFPSMPVYGNSSAPVPTPSVPTSSAPGPHLTTTLTSTILKTLTLTLTGTLTKTQPFHSTRTITVYSHVTASGSVPSGSPGNSAPVVPGAPVPTGGAGGAKGTSTKYVVKTLTIPYGQTAPGAGHVAPSSIASVMPQAINTPADVCPPPAPTTVYVDKPAETVYVTKPAETITVTESSAAGSPTKLPPYPAPGYSSSFHGSSGFLTSYTKHAHHAHNPHTKSPIAATSSAPSA